MKATLTENFLDYDKINTLAKVTKPSNNRLDEILLKAEKLNGLSSDEAAELLAIEDPESIQRLLETASKVKNEIYGKRMVLFAPLYAGNHCTNNCLYCGFRAANKDIHRIKLNMDQIREDAESLLKEGHKRVLLLSGESGHYPLSYTMDAIKAVYSAEVNGAKIRRVNVEIAPMDVDDFKTLKTADIGTYTCFQETYDPQLYKFYHPTGKKSDYDYRLNVMHRAMEAGIDDIGMGVLFGLADYRFEVIALMEHAADLEKKFGCGPHTVSVPRLEPAPGSAISEKVPFPVSDDEFRKIISIIRIAMPYTGIILSTRESVEIRNELFQYGISQVSAGSRTTPGGYSISGEKENKQFSLGDHRSLEEVINDLTDGGFIPSFCTGCYRKGRVGHDFMDLAKPGLIKKFCMPNGLVSYAEYLSDYAPADLAQKGFALIDTITENVESESVKEMIKSSVNKVKSGVRDIYL
ncbi:MAG: [FeFe] hydrogenase H-cluster radical SAM maturase HydG [Spirochaetaceae bacterium]|jgi:2-iminoacetate synthase|nr:[FeFe] hydrogenase H-cluster radical SAM maturase HydG [Spirochaetaceae bacterium]